MKQLRSLKLIASIRQHNRKEHERAVSQILNSIEECSARMHDYRVSSERILQGNNLDAHHLAMLHYCERAKESFEPVLQEKHEQLSEEKALYTRAKSEEQVIDNVIDLRMQLNAKEKLKKQQIQLEEVALLMQRKEA